MSDYGYWYAYMVQPIDNGWEYLKTVSQTLEMMATHALIPNFHAAKANDVDGTEIIHFLKAWEQAKDAALSVGWEGDFRHEAVVMWIPAEAQLQFGFVFKQDNNGTSLVISPQPLPHLEIISYNFQHFRRTE